MHLGGRLTWKPLTPKQEIEEIIAAAIGLAIARGGLMFDPHMECSQGSLIKDVIDAMFGVGTCEEEPMDCVKRLLDAHSTRRTMQPQASEKER